MWKRELERISPVSKKWLNAAHAHWDSLTKPRKSLGMLETIAARMVAIREEVMPRIPSKKVFVFAGDHGVVSEDVSPYPQEVTGLMVKNFLQGGAGINVLARCAGADVDIIDLGMKDDLVDASGLVRRNVRRGTRNMAEGPAMTHEETERALDIGVEMADRAFKRGIHMVATGEMGIGNTTPSSALFAALLPAPVADVTGKGTGLDDRGLVHKITVIRQALEVNRLEMTDPFSSLSAVGGLEIAGISGLCIGGAARRMMVVVDGFISSAAALVAIRLNPAIKDYLFFSHLSSERGHQVFLEKEGIQPILNLGLRLGEGTGAALAMQMMESALKLYREMATFKEMGITPGA